MLLFSEVFQDLFLFLDVGLLFALQQLTIVIFWSIRIVLSIEYRNWAKMNKETQNTLKKLRSPEKVKNENVSMIKNRLDLAKKEAARTIMLEKMQRKAGSFIEKGAFETMYPEFKKILNKYSKSRIFAPEYSNVLKSQVGS